MRYTRHSGGPIQRFWAKVNKQGSGARPGLGRCWEWVGAIGGTGYGALGVGARVVSAHRMSFEIFAGRPPVGCVLHRCDNRLCVRPSHLFEGTKGDNVRDMHSKGRARPPRGERHPRAKLDAAKVAVIRSSVGVSDSELGRRFGVAPTTVRAVRLSLSWVST